MADIDVSNVWYLIAGVSGESINQTVMSLSQNNFDASLAIISLGNMMPSDDDNNGHDNDGTITDISASGVDLFPALRQGNQVFFYPKDWGNITDLDTPLNPGPGVGVWVLTKDHHHTGEDDQPAESQIEFVLVRTDSTETESGYVGAPPVAAIYMRSNRDVAQYTLDFDAAHATVYGYHVNKMDNDYNSESPTATGSGMMATYTNTGVYGALSISKEGNNNIDPNNIIQGARITAHDNSTSGPDGGARYHLSTNFSEWRKLFYLASDDSYSLQAASAASPVPIGGVSVEYPNVSVYTIETIGQLPA